MVEQPVLDATECVISSSLTVLNVQLNSQGAYVCGLQDNNFTLNQSVSLLNVQSSTEGTCICDSYKGYYVDVTIY